MIQFNAHFDGSVLRPDEPVDIPVGAKLRVIVETSVDDGRDTAVLQRLGALAESCGVQGPNDLADQHDHYAHGRPKR